jgi:hypothetical protein
MNWEEQLVQRARHMLDTRAGHEHLGALRDVRTVSPRAHAALLSQGRALHAHPTDGRALEADDDCDSRTIKERKKVTDMNVKIAVGIARVKPEVEVNSIVLHEQSLWMSCVC